MLLKRLNAAASLNVVDDADHVFIKLSGLASRLFARLIT